MVAETSSDPSKTAIPDVIGLQTTRDAGSQIHRACRFATLDHKHTTVLVGKTTRYWQGSTNRVERFVVEESLIESHDIPRVRVTPHIVPGTNKIILDVSPNKTSVASVLVRSGQTAVFRGLPGKTVLITARIVNTTEREHRLIRQRDMQIERESIFGAKTDR